MKKEYEKYMKTIVDKFSELCSTKMDYQDYCNYIQIKNPNTLINFRQANERALIDIMISGELKKEDVKKIIIKRQEFAKKWLSENILTYNEWIIKQEKND